MYLGITDAELEEIIDAQDRVELTSEQYDALLFEKKKAREAGLAEGTKKAKEAIKDALKNGTTPPPSAALTSPKKGNTPMYVGIGVAALIALLYMRSQEKGGSKSKVSYSFMGGKKKKKKKSA